MRLRALAAILILAASGTTAAQLPQASAPRPAVEKLGGGAYRIGQLRVDTTKREVIIRGTLNDVITVEFVASSRDGMKAYESAITLDTDAVSFNTALLLIGLDPSRSKPSKNQFDPVAPEGDPVELLVDLPAGGRSRRVPLNEILFDKIEKKTLAPGPWVYAASSFIVSPEGSRFLAELEGVLIGLMHGPAAIIDNPRNDVIDRFGEIVLNPAVAKAGMKVSVIIRALPLAGANKPK